MSSPAPVGLALWPESAAAAPWPGSGRPPVWGHYRSRRRLVVQAATDEVLVDGVGVVGGRPGHADLARADACDGPVSDAGACVVTAGGFGDQGDAIAVGDRGQVGVGLIGDGSDADRVTLAFGGGQMVIAPEAGFLGRGDERLVPQLAETDLISGGER